MSESQPLNIALPPDFVFKYRRPSRTEPSREVITSQGVFDFVGVKYPPLYNESEEFFTKWNLKREWFKYPVTFSDGRIYIHEQYPALTKDEEAMGGQLACFKDCPYPVKGHPFPQAIFAVNMAKRLSRQFIEFFSTKDILIFVLVFLVLRKKKKVNIAERFLTTYAETCRKAMEAFVLEERFMSKYGQEILHFITRLLTKWGVSYEVARNFAEAIASQIDWDNAYWMRIGDAMAETTQEKMIAHPRKELERLAAILVERNPQDPWTAQRLSKALITFSKLLYVPRYKRIFTQSIKESTFSNFQFDEADRYHACLYADYNYLGKTIEERYKMYKEYHVAHPPEPPRLQIQP